MRASIRAATNTVIATREHLLDDLRGLSVLDFAQRFIAIGALVAIAVHAIVASPDDSARVEIGLVLTLALAFLALAARIRSGADLVRRDLWLLEATEDGRREHHDADAHPYRAMPPPHAPPHPTRRSRGLRVASVGAIAMLASALTLACVAIR